MRTATLPIRAQAGIRLKGIDGRGHEDFSATATHQFHSTTLFGLQDSHTGMHARSREPLSSAVDCRLVSRPYWFLPSELSWLTHPSQAPPFRPGA
ncbi:hypothetical protein LSTR_LSTR003313 [Laodelphax striatellus]|uniref:Uncharacterized protein n=1 Tax=Laodelphax striatellus TaxID=195883 RepID=A0A482X500_LAOST|nr:hypothetical protein LSTR_LSTR003313 [Laodelphax striatellus]